MIRIEPTDEQVQYAIRYLEAGKIANRGNFDGDRFAQLDGIKAQIIVCDFLGLPRPINNGTFDGGWDIEWAGRKWDIKCERRTCFFNTRTFMHNLNAWQINYKTDGYIFMNCNRSQGVFELCGYIVKEHLKERAMHHPEGTKRKRDDGTEMIVKGALGMYEIADQALIKFPVVRRG